MRHAHRFDLALAAMLAASAAFAAAPPVPAFTAHYQLLQNGAPMGTATLTLAPSAGGAWTFTTDSKGTAGLAALLGATTRETSTFHWHGDLPQCDRYDYTLDAAIKQKHRSVRCDWQAHTITVDDKGTHTFASEPGALERHTVPLALAAGLASGQHTFNLPVAVLDRIEIQHYAAQTPQSVTVPDGTFTATPVARTDGGDGIEAWFAPTKLPVPVKIEQRGKNTFVLELQSWSAN